jgi:phage baseplate assembly protein W
MATWREIDSKFVGTPKGGLLLALDFQAVVSSIDNILRTRKGERVMLPEFGSDLGDILFENIDDTFAEHITDSIKQAIETWDPRVTVSSIRIQPNYDQHYMAVFLQFTIKGITTSYTYEGKLFL